MAVRSSSVAAATVAPETGCCVTPLRNRDVPPSEGTISPKRSAMRRRFEGSLPSHRIALIVATTSRSPQRVLTITPIRNDPSLLRSASGCTVICEPATVITRPMISFMRYALRQHGSLYRNPPNPHFWPRLARSVGFLVKFIRDAYCRELGPTLRKSGKYLVNFCGGNSSSYPGRKTFRDGKFVDHDVGGLEISAAIVISRTRAGLGANCSLLRRYSRKCAGFRGGHSRAPRFFPVPIPSPNSRRIISETMRCRSRSWRAFSNSPALASISRTTRATVTTALRRAGSSSATGWDRISAIWSSDIPNSPLKLLAQRARTPLGMRELGSRLAEVREGDDATVADSGAGLARSADRAARRSISIAL